MPKKSRNKFEGKLEIVSLNGHFNNGDVHLHLSFADEGCNVFWGHLEEGCIVKKGTDILLISFEQKIINISNNDLTTNESLVKVYILKDCPWSKRAIRLLNSLYIPHEVTLIDNDESFQKIKAKSSRNTFPQIFVDNEFFGGYDELSEQAKLDNFSLFK